MKTINIVAISRLRTYTDGKGISTLVVCTECSLRCAYCLNPFSWDGSISPKTYNVEELFNVIKKDNIYFLSTGGGVVFGGGEPLLHHEFIKEFITKYKSTGWKFTLETSLNVKHEYLKDIIDYIDYFIVDTKDMDKGRYELYTKGNYDIFLKNLIYLLKNTDAKKIKIRVPRIPKLHVLDDVKSNYRMLEDMGFENIEVFNYIEPIKIKKISDIALKNKNDFIDFLNKD